MDIYREQTNSEKRLAYGGFKDIRKWRKEDAWQLVLKQISEKYQKWVHEKKKPYARKLAMEIAQKKLEELDKQVKKNISAGKLDVKFDFDVDFDSFADEKLFTFVGEKEIIEDKLIDGMRQSIITGVYKDYICEKSGENISIEIKNHELEKLKNGIKDKTQEKENPTSSNKIR